MSELIVLKPRGAGYGLWSLIIGIAAVVLSLFVIGGALGCIAIGLAIIALFKSGRKDVAIPGLAAGAAALVVALFALVFWVGYFNARSRATAVKIALANRDLLTLSTAIEKFKKETGRYPNTNEGLAALVEQPTQTPNWHQCVPAVPLDPWSDPFVYQSPGIIHPNSFDLISVGADGKEGTADDITN